MGGSIFAAFQSDNSIKKIPKDRNSEKRSLTEHLWNHSLSDLSSAGREFHFILFVFVGIFTDIPHTIMCYIETEISDHVWFCSIQLSNQFTKQSSLSQNKIENMWRWKYLHFWAFWGVRWELDPAWTRQHHVSINGFHTWRYKGTELSAGVLCHWVSIKQRSWCVDQVYSYRHL